MFLQSQSAALAPWCVYVRVRVCVFVQTYIYIHACMDVQTYYTYIHTYTHKQLHVYAYTQTHIHVYVRAAQASCDTQTTQKRPILVSKEAYATVEPKIPRPDKRDLYQCQKMPIRVPKIPRQHTLDSEGTFVV